MGGRDALADEVLEVALAVDLGRLEQAAGVTDVYGVGGRRRLHVSEAAVEVEVAVGAWSGGGWRWMMNE